MNRSAENLFFKFIGLHSIHEELCLRLRGGGMAQVHDVVASAHRLQDSFRLRLDLLVWTEKNHGIQVSLNSYLVSYPLSSILDRNSPIKRYYVNAALMGRDIGHGI
jgi:hypothetical protein